MSKFTVLVKKIAIFSLVFTQFSCYHGKLDPFDFQNGLSRNDIRDAIVKLPDGVKSKQTSGDEQKKSQPPTNKAKQNKQEEHTQNLKGKQKVK